MGNSTLSDRISALALECIEETVDFCQRLIRTPSLPGNEKKVADLYIDEMEKIGYDEVFRDDWGNVVGIVKGTLEGPTIMFNSHMDHVDTGDLSEWEGYDPYGAQIDEVEVDDQDKMSREIAKVIHGRAASDVKGGGAVQIYSGKMLIMLREEGFPIKGNYMFTGVVLEEPSEQLGMVKLIDDTFKKRNMSFDGVVSSEATALKLYLGHRGRVEIKVTISGQTSHGSAPWLGVNAVNKSTRFIDMVEEVVKNEAKKDEDLGESSIALTIIDCTPGALCIVPDRCHITYDRRFVPGETAKGCIEQIQKIIDRLSSQDSNFRAKVEISMVPRTTYTGLTAKVPNMKEAWKIEKEHPFVKAAAKALKVVKQEVKYGHWDFGTDLSKVCAIEKKPAIGYSPMQEQYCHRPNDKVRIDYMQKALEGNTSIFLGFADMKKEDFYLY